MKSALRRWQRINPLVPDSGLAVLLFGLVLLQASSDPHEWSPLSIGIVTLETLPLALRRRTPGPVMAVVGMAAVAHLAAGFRNEFFDTFAVMTALYTVAAHGSRRTALAFLFALPVALALALALDWHNKGAINLLDIPYNLLVLLSAWLLGDNLQARRAYAAQLEERERLLAREREERARATLAEERARIARELHDIVAHSVSVMVLQANAGERIMPSRPEQASEHFAAIQAAGREALAELRRLLGVLREGERGDGEREPQPGIAEIDQLALQARRAGLDTAVAIEGDATRMPEAVQLSAYRIVQEALTNTLRHAGASHASVAVRSTPAGLEVEVLDDGRRRPAIGNGATPAQAAGSGHGLIGMRERVQLFGGELQAGSLPQGGFRVRALIPIDARP